MDNLVKEKIEKLDAKDVYETIKENNISVCGYGPIMALIEFSKYKDTKNHILRRGHSGEISQSNNVVNYIYAVFSQVSNFTKKILLHNISNTFLT